MRMCMPHWEQLRQGVKDRGMMHLVLKSGEEAVKNMKAEIEGAPAKFDPLMAANWAIFSQALNFGGLDMMVGEHCPLCEADAHGGHAQEWIDGCLDAQLEYAIELGLVKKES